MTEVGPPVGPVHLPSPDEEYLYASNTPGPQGYLVAVAISWILITVGTLAGPPVLAGEVLSDVRGSTLEDVEIGLEFLLGWSIFVGFMGVLTAPFGVWAVNATCRWIEHQWVHVLAAGVAGLVLAYAVASVLGIDGTWRDYDRLAVGVAGCTAFARAAVVPMVPAVRCLLAFRPEGSSRGMDLLNMFK